MVAPPTLAPPLPTPPSHWAATTTPHRGRDAGRERGGRREEPAAQERRPRRDQPFPPGESERGREHAESERGRHDAERRLPATELVAREEHERHVVDGRERDADEERDDDSPCHGVPRDEPDAVAHGARERHDRRAVVLRRQRRYLRQGERRHHEARPVDRERPSHADARHQQSAEQPAEGHLQIERRAEPRVGSDELLARHERRHRAARRRRHTPREHVGHRDEREQHGVSGQERRDGEVHDALPQLADEHQTAPVDAVGDRSRDRSKQARQRDGEQQAGDRRAASAGSLHVQHERDERDAVADVGDRP